jgi:hypothetical protein
MAEISPCHLPFENINEYTMMIWLIAISENSYSLEHV